MKLSRRLRLGVGGLIVAVTAILAWFVVLRSPAPSEAQGKARLNGLADLLTSSRLLGTKAIISVKIAVRNAADLRLLCMRSIAMWRGFVPASPKRRKVLSLITAGLATLILPLCPVAAAAQDAATAPVSELIAKAQDLAPVALYTLAGRLFAQGRRDEAAVWFYTAQIRSRFRLAAEPNLPPDGEPALYAALADTLGRPINEWAFGDVDRAAAEMKRALDRDSAHPNAYTPKAGHGAALAQIHSGLTALRASVLSQRDDIRRQRAANGLSNR